MIHHAGGAAGGGAGARALAAAEQGVDDGAAERCLDVGRGGGGQGIHFYSRAQGGGFVAEEGDFEAAVEAGDLQAVLGEGGAKFQRPVPGTPVAV